MGMITDYFPMPWWPTPIGIWAAKIDFGDYKNSPVDMKMRGKCIRFTEGMEEKNRIGILRIYYIHVWNVQRKNSILTKGKRIHEWKIIRCLNYKWNILYASVKKSSSQFFKCPLNEELSYSLYLELFPQSWSLINVGVKAIDQSLINSFQSERHKLSVSSAAWPQSKADGLSSLLCVFMNKNPQHR